MKAKLIAIFFGIISVLLTYYETRAGSTLVSLVLVILIAAAGGIVVSKNRVASTKGQSRIKLILAYVFGVLLGELSVFIGSYSVYGFDDPKLAAGVSISVLEFLIIGLVGVSSMLFTFFAASRITRQ